MPKNTKRKIEHSKIITSGVLVLSAIVVLFTLVMIWRTEDTSVLSILIPSVETAFCLTAKHYYAKAAAENQIKLSLKYGDVPVVDSTADDDIERHG